MTLFSFTAFSEWYGEHNLSEEIRVLKRELDEISDFDQASLAQSTKHYLKVLRVRLSKHDPFIGRSDELSWMRHDLVLFRQIRKNIGSQKGTSLLKEMLGPLNALEKKYKKILKK